MLYFLNFLVSSYVVCTRHWSGARKIIVHSYARYASLLRLKLSHCTRHPHILRVIVASLAFLPPSTSSLHPTDFYMYPYDWLIQKGGLYNFKHIFNIQLYIYSGGILSSRDYNYKKSIPYEAYWRIQELWFVFHWHTNFVLSTRVYALVQARNLCQWNTSNNACILQ